MYSYLSFVSVIIWHFWRQGGSVLESSDYSACHFLKRCSKTADTLLVKGDVWLWFEVGNKINMYSGILWAYLPDLHERLHEKPRFITRGLVKTKWEKKQKRNPRWAYPFTRQAPSKNSFSTRENTKSLTKQARTRGFLKIYFPFGGELLMVYWWFSPWCRIAYRSLRLTVIKRAARLASCSSSSSTSEHWNHIPCLTPLSNTFYWAHIYGGIRILFSWPHLSTQLFNQYKQGTIRG